MRSIKLNPKSDLRAYYTVFLELGVIVTLLIFIVATKIDFSSEKKEISYEEDQEVIKMEEVVKTQHEEMPPPPPRPQIPIEVPNDEIIEEQEIYIDAEINLDQPLILPTEPKTKVKQEESFFIAVEQMPELVDGLSELQKKVIYPKNALDANISGLVIVQFIVTKEGNVKNPKVIRGIGGGCDQEALRVVKNAKFKPGRQRGMAVAVQYSLPIRFKLKRRHL